MIRKLLLLGISVFMVSSCAELLNLLQMANIKNPNVSVSDTRITALSFSQVDLLVDVNINNPNTVGINLAGMTYDLKINNHSLINGIKNDPLQISANDNSIIQLPLSIKYEDIYGIITTVSGKEKSDFLFEGTLSFDLPVLGKVSLPVSKSGEVPLIKIPKIKVKKLSLKTFAFSNAQLEVDVAISGAGGLPLFINNFNYGLNIAGNLWVGGNINKKIAVSDTGEKIVTIPFKLDFITMGKTVYDIVAGNSKFDYSFTGDMNISSDIPLLKASKLAFTDLDKISISK